MTPRHAPEGRRDGTRTINEVIGANLRRLRLESDLTQDELGRILRWRRSTVAAAEGGTKTFDVGDLVLMGANLSIPISELLRGKDEFVVSKSTDDEKWINFPLDGARRILATANTNKRARITRRSRRTDSDPSVIGEAEQKASRKLGITPQALHDLAVARWDRSLTSERDRRVAEAAPDDASPRSIQAYRGRVTRALLAELEEFSDAINAGAREGLVAGLAAQAGRSPRPKLKLDPVDLAPHRQRKR